MNLINLASFRKLAPSWKINYHSIVWYLRRFKLLEYLRRFTLPKYLGNGIKYFALNINDRWIYRNPLLNVLKPTAGKRAKFGGHHSFVGGKSCVLIAPFKNQSPFKYWHLRHSQRSGVWRKWIVVRHIKSSELLHFQTHHWCTCQKWSHTSTCQTGNPSCTSIIVVYFAPADTCFFIFFHFWKGRSQQASLMCPTTSTIQQTSSFSVWLLAQRIYSAFGQRACVYSCNFPCMCRAVEQSHNRSFMCAWSYNVGVQGRASTDLVLLWSAGWWLFFTYAGHWLQHSLIS